MKIKIPKFDIRKKNTLITIFAVTFVFVLGLPINVHAEASSSIGNLLVTGICHLLLLLGDLALYLCKNAGGSIEQLVFNASDITKDNMMVNGHINLSNLKLTLLTNAAISKQMYKVYYTMQYLAVCVLCVIGFWITVDLLKAGSDVRHKTVAIDRVKKLVITIFLLTSLPLFIDIMLTINYVLTDVFRSLIQELLKEKGITDIGLKNGFLMQIFKDQVKVGNNSTDQVIKNVLYTIMYLGSGFINIWLIVFYMIRDLTISFLFMLAPILCVFLPFKSELILKWLKEMASNIFTQAIQGFVLFTTLSIATANIKSGNKFDATNLYSSLFCLVSFFMFIPITGMIKKLIGLESDFGAGKSTAGLGGVIGAVGLAGMGAKMISSKSGQFSEYRDKMRDLKGEEGEVKKGISSSSGGTSVGSTVGNNTVPPQKPPRTIEQIQGEQSRLKRQFIKNTAGGASSLILGGAMAASAGALGTPMGVMAGANLGGATGGMVGSGVAGMTTDATRLASDKVQDKMFGAGNRPELTNVTSGMSRYKTLKENRQQFVENIQSNISGVANAFTGHTGENAPEYKGVSDNFVDSDNFGGEQTGFVNKVKHGVKRGVRNTRIAVDNISQNIDTFKSSFDGSKERKQELSDANIGLQDDPIKDTEFYEQERTARLSRATLTRRGKFEKARMGYATGTYDRKDHKALQEIQSDAQHGDEHPNVYQYQSADATILYTQNETNGERTILHSSAGHGDKNKKPTIQGVGFTNSKNITIPEPKLQSIRREATIMTDEAMQGTNFEEGSREYDNQLTRNIQTLTQNYIEQLQNLRIETGCEGLVLEGNEKPYTRQQFRGTGVNNVANEGTRITLNPSAIKLDTQPRTVDIAQSINYAHNAQHAESEYAEYHHAARPAPPPAPPRHVPIRQRQTQTIEQTQQTVEQTQPLQDLAVEVAVYRQGINEINEMIDSENEHDIDYSSDYSQF